MKRQQATIACVSAGLFLLLLIRPPWQEAAQKEFSYRKSIGRGFLWKPPKTIPVDCYFAGCVVAPASYFHAVLNRALLLQQTMTLLVATCALLWIFRKPGDGYASVLASRTTSLAASFALALLVPTTGGVPLGAALAYVPGLFINKGEFWLALAVFIPGFYLIVVLILFGVFTVLRWLVRQSARVPSTDGSGR